ncbi:BAL_1a_G0032510.mRNA.1.CDS.1 [Saccharomyces cerevisiae]|nr:BAL_1a_G0032510.mRNA.1.CDS.1 [Saccharomyces cerevisiae]CAI7203062.1 BAL_1a_G0032510.mRNA.1.CDS.1 [Saccharomyces cerevisiae]
MQYDYGTEDNEVNHIYSENERQKERENECAGPCLYLAPPADVCIFFLFPFVLSPRGGGKEKKKKKVRKVRCASPLLLLHPDITPNTKPRAAVVSNRSTHSSTCRRWLCFVYNWLVCTDGSCWTLIIGLYTGSHIWALTHCKHSSKSRGTLTVSPGAPPGTCSCSIRAVPSSSACKITAVARRAEVLVMVSRPGSNPGLESPSLSGDNSASWSTAAEIILSVIVVARDSTAPKPIPGKE